MKILAIDPGPKKSGLCKLAEGYIEYLSIEPNMEVINRLRFTKPDVTVVIEDIQSYGMTVGKDVFRTCMWVGAFCGEMGMRTVLLPRREVKLELCENPRAKDKNIRQAILDILGPKPTKARPNPNYGGLGHPHPTDHEWSAIALAIAWRRLVDRGMDHHFGGLTDEAV